MTKKKLDEIMKAGYDLVSAIEQADKGYLKHLTPHMEVAIAKWADVVHDIELSEV